ncbi:MAG: hypothetical protein WCT16_04455 [Candidatus Buchananbacteria bacterium]
MKLEEVRFTWRQTEVKIAATTQNGLDPKLMGLVTDDFGPLFNYYEFAVQIAISITQLPDPDNPKSFFITEIKTPLISNVVSMRAEHVDPILAIIAALNYWLGVIDRLLQSAEEVIDCREQGKELPQWATIEKEKDGAEEKIVIMAEEIMDEAYQELIEEIKADIEKIKAKKQKNKQGESGEESGEDTDLLPWEEEGDWSPPTEDLPLPIEDDDLPPELTLPANVNVDDLLSEAFGKKPHRPKKQDEDP